MYCENCGFELEKDAKFCSNCGKGTESKNKNIYIALLLTVVFAGLGSIYAGKTKKGLVIVIARLATAIIGSLLSIFLIFSVLLWTYSFYEAYNDVEIANGNSNPNLISDFKGWNQNKKIIGGLIIGIILICTVIACVSVVVVDNYSPSHSGTHYYTGSSSGGGSSHYGGVDTSPSTIAKNDPDWYYDYYEYGDNPDIDDYLESQGY